MNILDFLHNSGICESKSDARRCIKANRISVDFKKITDDKADVPFPYILGEGDKLESTNAGEWLIKMNDIANLWKNKHSTSELVFIRLANQVRHIRLKGLDEVFDKILDDIFVVENGKKNLFIVTIKYAEYNECLCKKDLLTYENNFFTAGLSYTVIHKDEYNAIVLDNNDKEFSMTVSRFDTKPYFNFNDYFLKN